MILRAALLGILVLAAGCAAPAPKLHRLGDAEGFSPYYHAYRDDVTRGYNRTFAFPVEAGAARVNATVALHMRSGGVIPGGVAPGVLDVVLRDADNATVSSARLDAASPNATFLVGAPHVGTWRLTLAGDGLGADGQMTEVAATYELVLQTEA